MQLRKVFFNDTLVYGVTGYLGLVASFFLTPFYTRILTKEDYGLLDLFNVWNSFFALVLPLGLFTAILRLYKDFKNKILEVNTCTLFKLCTNLAIYCLIDFSLL